MKTSMKEAVRRLAGIGVGIGLLLGGAALPADSAQDAAVAAPLALQQVVERMVTMNQRRTEALRSFQATRAYHLEFHGIVDKRADMTVQINYTYPNRKEFTILAETGSELLRNRVLRRLVEAEVEAANEENLKRTSIHPDNYEFRLVGYERALEREFYVLEALPREKNKFLFRGKIWVDGRDFAIVRIEGEPAKNPSWWTKRNQFQHSYKKVGDFWLPSRNETATQVRFFGRSMLTIDYGEYRLNDARAFVTLPPPPAVSAGEAGSK